MKTQNIPELFVVDIVCKQGGFVIVAQNIPFWVIVNCLAYKQEL